MPPPPPPPPPGGFGPPPPPPPQSTSLFGGKSSSSSGDRSALLSDIHKGLKLKKAVTNDRSSPLVSSNVKSSTNGTTTGSSPLSNANDKNSSNSSKSPVSSNLGGLFVNGMPKLKPINSKFLPQSPSAGNSTPSNTNHNSNNNNNFSPQIHLNGSNKLSSNNKSSSSTTLNKPQRFPVASQKPELPKTKSNWNGSGTLSKSSTNLSSGSSTLKNNNKSSPEFQEVRSKLVNLFDSDSNGKTLPSSNNNNNSSLHKLSVNTKYNTINPRRSDRKEDMPAHKGQAPQPPTGGGNLQRSISQANSGSRPKISTKPPNVKPPPPPKQSVLSSGFQRSPAPPVPPPPIHQNSVNKPPAPPRVASISDEISSHTGMTPNSIAREKFFKNETLPNSTATSNSTSTNTASSSSKMGYNHSHSSSQVSLNSKLQRPSQCPPPPPSRFSSVNNTSTPATVTTSNNDQPRPLKPAPPPPIAMQIEQLIADAGWVDPAPPPPQRGSSRSFASRFVFVPIHTLPSPEPMLNLNKIYSSQIPKTRKSGAPPIPESSYNGQSNNNFLHSQPLGIGSNNQDKKFHIHIQRKA